VLATAHDMVREHRVITALAPTDVPVPETFALCEDTDVIGAPFYVMELVEGTPYRLAAQLEPLGADRVRTISTAMVDTLAALHRVDPAVVGLADFGRPEGFLGRQVRRWKKQLDASPSRDLAGADELHLLLETHLPQVSAPTVVHGDYRLDNLLVHDDAVAAVIDWEMATLGDPLTDVALLLVYQQLATLNTSGASLVVADASTAPGFLGRDEVLARYAEGAGRDLSRMGFYEGLAYFKLAVILEGIERTFERLSASIPPQRGATIVHGDYRLDNCMLGFDNRIAAVLDWEICTLGDPLADVGLLMVYWNEATDEQQALINSAATALPGFLSRAELLERYGQRSGRDLSAVDFYVAFGYWKLACIVEGVYARYAHGAMGKPAAGFEGFATQTVRLAEAAKAAVDKFS
jgi:aminoglycoside phosphotransferase (APT) family kinase protein